MEKIITIDEKLYGRLKSRSLTEKQKTLFTTLFHKVAVNSFEEMDVKKYEDTFLEIGFGSGEHLVEMALKNPTSLFVGCEPFVNGVASILVKIEMLKIENIRIFQGDAKIFIKTIPENTLSGVFLLFPDPWPKRKHIKRRFLQQNIIISIHKKLKSNGFWRIATDHKEYAAWIVKLFAGECITKIFTAEIFDTNSRFPTEIWPETKYEKKATDTILYAIYTKKLRESQLLQ
ncbi:MAG: tRNA (guanosine(46)-N7)-methyltransferase TrmB [Holosporales bacterium]|jgi:tRNA (guanine-N7-)-methyltransferase|nr:tRNA (guanosine(46)-N7)-methyltransferase TrmB [Holosporales bacterium]